MIKKHLSKIIDISLISILLILFILQIPEVLKLRIAIPFLLIAFLYELILLFKQEKRNAKNIVLMIIYTVILLLLICLLFSADAFLTEIFNICNSDVFYVIIIAFFFVKYIISSKIYKK